MSSKRRLTILLIRGFHVLYFLMIWLAMLYLILFCYPAIYAGGTPRPTVDRHFALTQRGNTVYITFAEQVGIALSIQLIAFAFLGWIALAFKMHFGWGIKVFPHWKTRGGLFAKNGEKPV